MFSARRTLATIPIELAVRIQVIGLEITIYTFAARARGASPRCGFDHDQRGFILLGHLCRRKPGLLQRGILAEQRFLQRPSHTFSLQSVKFLGPRRKIASGNAATGTPHHDTSIADLSTGRPATLLDHQNPGPRPTFGEASAQRLRGHC